VSLLHRVEPADSGVRNLSFSVAQPVLAVRFWASALVGAANDFVLLASPAQWSPNHLGAATC
jgi:hypothetical protein